jgi:hypothetical protein
MILQIISFLVLLFLLSFFRQKFVRHIFRRCFLFLNFKNGRHFKMTANIFFFRKSLKIQELKDFNGNGYLQGVGHAAPYCDHFGLLWRHFESKMTTKIQKSSDLCEIVYYYRHDRVKNWALIISCYVLTLFFIHTTSTCIVRLGDICRALRYSSQYLLIDFIHYCNLFFI